MDREEAKQTKDLRAQLAEAERERDEWRALAEKRRQEVTKLDDMRERLSAENHRLQQWYDWADLLAAKANLKELEE